MKKPTVDNGQNFDFGKTSKDYARYRDIYPQELYDRLITLGVGAEKSDWLDLGTGTGVVPRGLAKLGANITATDISENQISEAIALSVNMPNIRYKVCPAEDTGFIDNSFDTITACQCFWYFDPEKIVPEIKRLIKPGGMFVKVYMGWQKEDEIAKRSQLLVKNMNPNWTSGDAAVKDLTTHYFDNPILEKFTAELPFTRESWNGRIKACRGVLGSMSEEVFKVFEAAHLEQLETMPNEFTVKHVIFITSYKLDK